MVETSATMMGALVEGGVIAEAIRKPPSRTGALDDPEEKAPRGVGPASASARLICSCCLCRGDVAEADFKGELACAGRLV